jgi:hypothetical protein
MAVGILAYGSLRASPGGEIAPHVTRTVDVTTPFPVEFARLSATRGQAPTLVPFESGWSVDATVLVLSDSVTQAQATDMLYRRERHREGSGERYRPPTVGSLNAVVVETCEELRIADVENVLYTHLGSNIEPSLLSAAYLAEKAIGSVSKAAPQMDGISYLIGVTSVRTPLRERYEHEILARTATSSLEEALRALTSLASR